LPDPNGWPVSRRSPVCSAPARRGIMFHHQGLHAQFREGHCGRDADRPGPDNDYVIFVHFFPSCPPGFPAAPPRRAAIGPVGHVSRIDPLFLEKTPDHGTACLRAAGAHARREMASTGSYPAPLSDGGPDLSCRYPLTAADHGIVGREFPFVNHGRLDPLLLGPDPAAALAACFSIRTEREWCREIASDW